MVVGVIEPIDFRAIATGNQVAVDVGSDLNRVMAHLFLDVEEPCSLLNEE